MLHISSVLCHKLKSSELKVNAISHNLNFVIHFIVAAELFAVDNFDVPHVVGLGVVMLLMDR